MKKDKDKKIYILLDQLKKDPTKKKMEMLANHIITTQDNFFLFKYKPEDFLDQLRLETLAMLFMLKSTFENPYPFYKWLFEANANRTDPSLLLLLAKLVETESESITLILKNIVMLLNQPIQLPYLLDCILTIHYKGKLGGFFEQIVDLLVGWSIDENTPKHLVKSTAVSYSNSANYYTLDTDFNTVKNSLLEKEAEIQKLTIQDVINEMSGVFIERYSFTLNLLENLCSDIVETKDTKILVIFNIILKSVYSKYIINDLDLPSIVEIAQTKDLETMFDFFSTCLMNPNFMFIYQIIYDLHFKLIQSDTKIYLLNVQKVIPGPENLKNLFLDPQFIKDYRNYDILPIFKIIISNEKVCSKVLWDEFMTLKEKELILEIKGKRVKNKLLDLYLQIFSFYKNSEAVNLYKKLYNLKLHEQTYPYLFNFCQTNNFFTKDQEAIDMQFQIINLFSKPNHYSRNMLGLNWIHGIIHAQKIINDALVLKLEHSLILYLKSSVVEKDGIVKCKIAEIWTFYLVTFGKNRRSLNNTYLVQQLFLQRLDDIDVSTRKAFFKCLCSIDPIDSCLSNPNQNYDECKRLIISAPSSGTFKSNHFNYMASYLGMASYIQHIDEFYISTTQQDLSEWLPNLFYITQMENILKSVTNSNIANVLQSAVISNDTLMYWGLWESARYLILKRFKCVFGGPLQTLEAIEKTLDSYITLFEQKSKSSQSQFCDLLKRVSHLLMFIEMLEIQVLNAARGCSNICSTPPKHCILFFNANLKVCQDWFTRIRPKLTRCAIIAENDGSLLRNGFKSLSEVFKNTSDKYWNDNVYNCFYGLSNTLISIKDTDGLVGLERHWKKNMPRNINSEFTSQGILKSLSINPLVTQGYLEHAVNESKNYLSNHNEKSIVTETIQQQEKQLQNYHFESKMLKYWQTEELDIQIGDISNLVMDIGISKTIFEISIANLKEKNVSVLDKIQDLISVCTVNNSFRTVDNVLLVQIMMHFINTQDSGIRLGKAKPKDRISSATITGKNLGQWIELYHIFRKNDKQRDPDIDEIANILTFLACDTKNLKLANRLINSLQQSLTPSATLKNIFKKARLNFELNDYSQTFNLLLETINFPIDHPDTIDLEFKARACHWFALWNLPVKIEMNSKTLKAIETCLGSPPDFKTFPKMEDWISNTFFELSTKIAPKFAKSWYLYGSFCYRFGRRVLDDLIQNLHSEYVGDQLYALQALIKDQPDECFEKIMKYFLFNLGEVRDDSLDFKNWKADMDEADVEKIDEILHEIQERLFDKFECGARSYFEFLQVYQFSIAEKGDKVKFTQSEVITTTLRLVRIFVRYGVAMDDVFSTGFKETPLVPWKNVIPQLFSRLHHPEDYVRSEISNLICRIGESTPHLIIYPTILGGSDNAESISCESYSYIINSLTLKNETLVNDVKRWIQELQRITVLWEETWQSGLEHLRGDIQARVTKLNRDINRINSNTSLTESEQLQLIDQTVSNLLKPLIFSVEKLCENTYLKGALTPHECKFIDRYAKQIEILTEFLTNCKDFTDFEKVWSPFNELLQNIIADSKNVKNATLSLKSLSPYLASLSGSAIHMPGLELDEMVMIDSCFNDVKLIPTKTKPKRIQLHSSNGKSYSYLLKGHEDLHLDERIQQFIGITNKLLQSEGSTSSRELCARTYSVIPFGRSYGMIQWIDNASGLFSLYRKWQYWEHTAKLLQKKEEVNITVSHPPRPYDSFMGKIQNAIKGGKMTKTLPRNQWPLEVLKSVFIELRSETPSDIIANELWTSSCTPISWWLKSKKFAQTVAVMSIVGYILGLGDRHLDNILIDLEEGSIVHVDFNVCFEKGKRLRVPETVPFRLTQNIVSAFGPTGVEGSFRIACQEVLKTLRKNQEILLTLLEAFIYDPLVDWTSNNMSEKQILNLNVNINLLISRINEQKSTLQDWYLEIPIHINTIHHLSGILENSLNKLEVFTMELGQVDEGFILDTSREKLNQSKTVISECYDEVKVKHFANKKFLLNFSKNFGNIRKINQKIAEQMNSDYSFGNKLAEYIRKRTKTLLSIFKSLEWYNNFLESDFKLFVSQDYFGKQMDVLSAVIEEDFTPSACSFALNTVTNLLDLKNSGKIHHMDNMYKVIFSKDENLNMLEKVVGDLQAVSTVSSIDKLGSKLQGNTATAVICYLIYILSEFGLISYRFSKGLEFKRQLETFIGERYNLLLSSTQLYFGSRLIQSEEESNLLDPIYCSILAGIYTSLLEIFQQLTESKYVKDGGISPKFMKEFQFQKIQLCFEKLSYILLREVMPLVIKSLVRGLSAVHLLCEKVSSLGDEASSLLEDSSSSQYFTNAGKIQDNFEEFTHLISEDDKEAQIIFSQISNLITMIEDMVDSSRSKASALKCKLFLKLMVIVGSFFREGIDFIANSSLIKTDPTAEFVIVFDESRLFRHHPKFRKSQNAFRSYVELVLQEVFLKPMLQTLSQYLSSLGGKISVNIVKTWGTFSSLSENTSVPSIDSARKILNYYIRNEDVTLAGLKDMQKSVLAKATEKYLESLEFRAVSSLENIKELMSIKKMALERYQRIHAQSLYVNFEDIPALSYRKQFIQTLQAGIDQLKKLNATIEEIERYQKDSDSLSNLKVSVVVNFDLGNEKSMISAFSSMCGGLILVEEGRLPTENIRTMNWKISQNLENIISCGERLELISEKGLQVGTLEHLKSSIDNLKIDESIEILKSSVLKLQHAVESMKKIVEPILKLMDNILNYSKDTGYNEDVLDSFIVCKKHWKNVKENTSKIVRVCESLGDNREGTLAGDLQIYLQTISIEVGKVISTIFSFSNIKEYTPAEVTDAKATNDNVEEIDTQRFNREQTRNLTAVNVLKLIKAKLDGADNPDHKHNSVEEHVDFLIKNATDVNNLAKMYEGWMSWI
ncbi:Serine/threonine-protein kinase smg1 [Boothiomyces sp. JEL0866]|nr:Serine/threonine-protein kinase smg1 [Boothiomyces sp. JEL0866]